MKEKTQISYHQSEDGIYEPSVPVIHRDDEYPEDGFPVLFDMQDRHFWYRGRHRFLLHELDRYLPDGCGLFSAVDLGGGAGGWVSYLADRRPDMYQRLALADSSRMALRMAGHVLPKEVARYQVDLMKLGWCDEWDVAFLLDVIEHLPDDRAVLLQAMAALKPGGLLFVTVPALKQFWSYNDELAHHQRRYAYSDFVRLGEETGLTLCDARYFMFLLSPLYWLTRSGRRINNKTEEEKRVLMHKVPSMLLNLPLTAIFAAETPIGHWLRFPWGTSLLGVYRK